MTLLPEEFNAENHIPSEERSIYPAGEYIAEIVNAELENTKAGDGQFVNVEYEFTDCKQNGDYAGRHYWDTFNLVNNNATAVEIAERQFTSLCIAVEKRIVKDTDELLDTPALGLKIIVKKANKKQIDGGYPDDHNVTVAWIRLQTGTSESAAVSTSVKSAPAKTATPASKPASSAPTHPWQKR